MRRLLVRALNKLRPAHAPRPALTAELLGAMIEQQAAAALAAAGVDLCSASREGLLAGRVTGRRLLRMDADLLHRCGVAPGDAQDVRELVALLRFGGPRTVLVELDSESTVERTFASPQDLEDFLGKLGAGALRSAADGASTAQFKQVRPPRAVRGFPSGFHQLLTVAAPPTHNLSPQQ